MPAPNPLSPAPTGSPREALASRRTVLQGATVVGLAAGAAPLLAACGSGSSTAPTTPDNTPSAGSAPAGSPPAGSAPPAGGLGPAADIPVGGGVVYGEAKVVVTQPTAGSYQGFTAVCTHQGCVVAKVEDGQIVCPCHGSHYSITDGSVLSGPAPAPLAPVEVSVEGGEVVLGS